MATFADTRAATRCIRTRRIGTTARWRSWSRCIWKTTRIRKCSSSCGQGIASCGTSTAGLSASWRRALSCCPWAAPRPAPGTPPEAPSRETELITQRVVRIPLDQLLSGKQSYNIVVRPGDVIRVPATPSGLVFMTGQVQRVGPITLGDGRLTILRAIDAAGGYAAIAVPEKIELTRMIGRSQQATISLDGRAIAEQTQPDVFLKPNDRVNVGTTFWALPLAIVRNGFRVNYGFGFIIDRNLSNDLFGPPPVNQFGE